MENAQKSLDLLGGALYLQNIDVRFRYEDDEVFIYRYSEMRKRVDVSHLTGLHMMQKVLENVNWLLIDEGYEA